jgi:Neurotransmitter-gated ion-channel ligand binding domain
MNMQQFPFDEQNCTFQMASWSYTNNELTLDIYDTSTVDLSQYVASSDWDLVSAGASRNYVQDSEDYAYYQLTFNIVIRRRPGFYLYVLIVPSLLLSLLTPGLFWIPPSRPDRTTLGKKTNCC